MFSVHNKYNLFFINQTKLDSFNIKQFLVLLKKI